MASNATPSLSRSLRRGTLPTRTLPQPGTGLAVAGAAAAPAADLGPLAAMLPGAGASAPAAAAAPAPTPAASALADLVEADESGAAPAAQPTVVPLSAPTPPSPPADVAGATPSVPVRSSRAARFGGGGAADPLARRTPAAAEAPTIPAAVPPGGTAPRSVRFADPERSADVVQARKLMQAAKVIAPLAAAAAIGPQRPAMGRERSKALTAMLLSVHGAALSVANHVSSLRNEDVPEWLMTNLMQSFAAVVADQWQRGRGADVGAMVEMTRDVMASAAGEVLRMLGDAADQAYREANTQEVANARIAVSASAASWDLFDWVSSESLSLEPTVVGRARTYTYDRAPAEIVNRLLRECIVFCRANPLNVTNADMRVAHMQGSIRRMANLLGAEYVAQTLEVMAWINQDGISDEEFAGRRKAAFEQFETRVLTNVVQHARNAFLQIEEGAYGAIEDLNEKQARPDAGGHVSARPVQQ